MTYALYRLIVRMLDPLLLWHLRRRLAGGKEDRLRFGERLGAPGRDRPTGPLVWVHGASVGEMVSVLPLIERLLRQNSGLRVMVTSGTVTSARIMVDRLPDHAFHQYVPIDRVVSVARFLDHWRPDLALWVESELWPNLIHGAQARGLPMAMINARMSETSYRRWRRLPFLIKPLLQAFQFCIAQSAPDAGRLATLGAHNVTFHGNLKTAALPLPVDPRDLHILKTAMARRPCWLAASTHPGEEAMAGAVHQQLRQRFSNLVTILVPRHAERGAAIAGELSAQGLVVARRSLDQVIAADTDIYLGDSMGEMGLYYRLAPIVFIGGSLVGHGGQNPLEAARLDSTLLFGPHMFNFTEQVAALTATGGAHQVADSGALAHQIALLLDDGVETQRRAAAAAAAANAALTAGGGQDVVSAILKQLAPLLPKEGRSCADT